MSEELGKYLTGSYRVRALQPAIADANRLLDRCRDRMELRRHSLKLRYWPEKCTETESGLVVDMDWSWVKSLPGMKVGELRIDDVIGGHENLRVIFFQGPSEIRDPLPLIWIIRVMDKKRDDFSKNDLAIFRARRLLVLQRFYSNYPR